MAIILLAHNLFIRNPRCLWLFLSLFSMQVALVLFGFYDSNSPISSILLILTIGYCQHGLRT